MPGQRQPVRHHRGPGLRRVSCTPPICLQLPSVSGGPCCWPLQGHPAMHLTCHRVLSGRVARATCGPLSFFLFPDARILCQGLLGRLVPPPRPSSGRPTQTFSLAKKRGYLCSVTIALGSGRGGGGGGKSVLTSSDVCLWSPFAGPPRAPAQGHVRLRVTWCMVHTRLKDHTLHL